MNATHINHVKAGESRTKFTGIWMVVVDGRIFARSYSLSKRSWYTTLLKGETGEIRCAKATVAVRGVHPADLAEITPAIQAAYESKYCVKAYNRKWVDGLCEPERVRRTMEFVPI
jgi:hypothetical protein